MIYNPSEYFNFTLALLFCIFRDNHTEFYLDIVHTMFCSVECIVILRHITRKSRLSLFSIMLSSLQYALYSLRSRHSFSFVSACYFRHGPVRNQRAIRGDSKRRIEIVTTAKVTSLILVRFPRNSTSMHFESSNTESALWETNSRVGRF